MKQLLHVITAVEFVGFKVKLQMCDAGGGNISALGLLTSGKANNFSKAKPEMECMRYRNPMSPSRHIWTSFCSVHFLKRAKNMLAYRVLVNKGKFVSWQVIRELYHHLKDNFENSMNVIEVWSVRRTVAYPDQFTQQNVNDTKSF